MKTIIFYAALAASVLTMSYSVAQETQNETSMEFLSKEKERIISEEKEALRITVGRINKQLENDEISFTQAETLKQEAAQKHALNIENRAAIIDNRIALVERNGKDYDVKDKLDISIFKNGGVLNFKFDREKPKYDRRTTSDFVLAIGLNNVMTKGESLDDSDFKIGGSRFAEIGWAWKTRVFKNTNWLRVKYGFSFQFNGLKPTDNRYFVDTGSQTELQVYPIDLDKSKFRMDNLVFPVHFEIGPSRKIEKEEYFRYDTSNKIKLGIGGYAGFNLGARQKLKFDENGEDVKQKLKANYNTNNFVYGVSAYLGWQGTAIYAKYDLNTIFKDNPVEQRNISLGLRFDMD